MNGAALEDRTAAYMSQFMSFNFAAFYADCSDVLRQSITQEALLQGWSQVLQAAGVLGESLGCVYTKQGGYDIVACTVEGTLNNIRVTVTYGSDGKPVGIWTSYAPKDPPAPQTAEKWEEFPVTVGEPGLPGMLTLPKGAAAPPVVILVQGSGASDMNETLGTAPNRPFEDIAHGLAELGVATLRYNKRTYQYSTAGVTIEYEVLNDAAAAVKLLCADSRVDQERIYLLGHSLGGMMAPKITADNPEIQGFISLAGSLRPLQDIVLDQNIAAIHAAPSLTAQQKSDLIAQATAETDKVKTLDDGGTGAILGLPTYYWESLNAIDGVSIVGA
jgi:dienelactone hydrolase